MPKLAVDKQPACGTLPKSSLSMKFLFHLATAGMIAASVALSSCAGPRNQAGNPDVHAKKHPTASTPQKNATPAKKTPAVTARKKTAAPASKLQTAQTAQTSKHAKFPFFSLSNPLPKLLPGPRLQVVKVREKDLKELPSGHERALAFERKRGFWLFGGPVDFKEPTLPEPGSAMDGSLLPPRIP
jgi:hypothetical protein